jgi:tetratricopeptide (TPR) repeat protein
LTDWNRASALQEMLERISEAPYTGQFQHTLRLQQVQRRLGEIRTRLQLPSSAEARAVYEEALRQRAEDPWLHHNYAEFLAATGDLAQAAAQMRRVCDLLPHHYAAYYQLGRLLARQRNDTEARQALEEARRRQPTLAEIHVELGQIDARQGKLQEALERYAVALECQPNLARVHLLRASVLEDQHRREEAIESLREAIRLRPGYAEAHYLLGIELTLTGRLPEARSAFEEAVRIRPTHAPAHVKLGITLARQGETRKALGHLQEALRLDPQNSEARQFLGTVQQFREITSDR